MKLTLTSLALIAALFSYSQYCRVDPQGYPVNPKAIPIDTMGQSTFDAMLAATTSCCCPTPYYYQALGNPTTAGYFRVFGDSLYINQTTFNGQNLDSLWMVIDQYKGSMCQFEYTINPAIFGIIEIEYNTGIDHGNWYSFGIIRIESPIPNYANTREHCFSYTVGGFPPGGYIPISGTVPGADVTGAIYFDGAAVTYLAPNPNGIDLTCQNGLDFSRYSIGENYHQIRANDGSDQLAVTLTDSSYHVDFTDPLAPGITYDVDYSANSPLTLVTKNYVDAAIAGSPDIPLTGTVTPVTGDIEIAGGNGFYSISGADDCFQTFSPFGISLGVNNSTTSQSTGIQQVASNIQMVSVSATSNTNSQHSPSGYLVNTYNSVLNLDAEITLVPGVATISAQDIITTYTSNVAVAPGQVVFNSTDPGFQANYGTAPTTTIPTTLVWRQWVEDYVTAWQGSGTPSTPGDYFGRRYHDNSISPYGVYEYTSAGWVLLN